MKRLELLQLKNQIYQLLGKNCNHYSIAYKNLAGQEKLIINPKRMVSASLIKLFIMIDAFKQEMAGTLDENKSIILRNSMKIDADSSLYNCPDGTNISVNQLINLMITESDNIATNILIDLQGMDRINQTIKELGCTETFLNRKMLDFESRRAGIDNYTSVEDLLMIFERIYRNSCINPIYDSKMMEILKKQKNNTKIPALLPQNTIVAHKTGELNNIEHDAGIVFDKNGDYIVCIMTNKENLEYDQLQSIRELSKIIFEFSHLFSLSLNDRMVLDKVVSPSPNERRAENDGIIPHMP